MEAEAHPSVARLSRQYLRNDGGEGGVREATNARGEEDMYAAERLSHPGHRPRQSVDGFELRSTSLLRGLDEVEEEREVREMGNGAAVGGGGGGGAPNEPAEDDDDDAERSGLKLGLGDFVFYSVLVARASLFDWVTTISTTIAVMMGLNATIFLLAIKRKALPALPISIALGLLFYFVGSIMLTPMFQSLSLGQVFI